MKVPYVRALLPLVTGLLLLKQGCAMPFHPLHSVQDAVWPVLLVLIGVAWELSLARKRPVDMGFLVLLGGLYWWFSMSCRPDAADETVKAKAKLVLLLVAVTTAVLIWLTARDTPRVSLLLVPLIGWILFAEHLPSIPSHIVLPYVTIDLPKVTDGSITFTGQR